MSTEIIPSNSNDTLYEGIRSLIEQGRRRAVTAVNTAMVLTYFDIGRAIVKHEQEGRNRAAYGKQTLSELSKRLTNEFGKGFSIENLRNMRRFYLAYSSRIPETASREFESSSELFGLSWSHYVFLIRLDNPDERSFYEIEAARNNWSLRELKRQFDSALYERLALSTDKEGMKALAEKGQLIEKPTDVVKDPYVLEFLDLHEETRYSEAQLETNIIDHLQEFLLELGRGFTFVGRQVRITYDEDHYWIDLVFFNRILKCFVLFDLKIGELKHQDIGQMQMYVNYYDRVVKLPEENKTIGILLCKKKKDSVIEMTLPEDNDQIFASQYMTVLPSKEELQKLLGDSDFEG